MSIWTTLAGPLGVVLTALLLNPAILPAYLAWVMATRYAFCLVLSLFRGGGFPISYPFLLYFSQIVGAAVKSFVMFRLDRQRWTRQGVGPVAATASARLGNILSSYVHLLTLGWLTLDGITNSPAKADLVFYNLSDRPSVDLFVPAVNAMALEDMAQNVAREVTLKAPLTLDFQVRDGTDVLATIPSVAMRRRAGVTVVFSGTAGAYTAFSTENLYLN